MYKEQDYVRQIREANARANKAGQRLFWDPDQKRIRSMSHRDPDQSMMEIARPDLRHSTINVRVMR